MRLPIAARRATPIAVFAWLASTKALTAAQYSAEIIEETAHIAFVRDTLMAAHGKKASDLPSYGTAQDARDAKKTTQN
jgi:L-fuculose-phosphate aldolase/L-ribulose-5-phosphate 4-epimerase